MLAYRFAVVTARLTLSLQRRTESYLPMRSVGSRQTLSLITGHCVADPLPPLSVDLAPCQPEAYLRKHLDRRSWLLQTNGEITNRLFGASQLHTSQPRAKKTNKLPASEAKPPPRRRGAAGGNGKTEYDHC